MRPFSSPAKAGAQNSVPYWTPACAGEQEA